MWAELEKRPRNFIPMGKLWELRGLGVDNTHAVVDISCQKSSHFQTQKRSQKFWRHVLFSFSEPVHRLNNPLNCLQGERNYVFDSTHAVVDIEIFKGSFHFWKLRQKSLRNFNGLYTLFSFLKSYIDLSALSNDRETIINAT